VCCGDEADETEHGADDDVAADGDDKLDYVMQDAFLAVWIESW